MISNEKLHEQLKREVEIYTSPLDFLYEQQTQTNNDNTIAQARNTAGQDWRVYTTMIGNTGVLSLLPV